MIDSAVSVTVFMLCYAGFGVNMIKRIINWVAERSDVVRRLRAELDADVAYHSHYSGKIDKALKQPRNSGDLLSNHLRAIEGLQSRSEDIQELQEALRTDEGVAAWRREQALNGLLREAIG